MNPSGKAFEPTDDQRRQVQAMSGYGLPHPNIGAIIGCSAQTLRRYFRAELDLGAARVNLQLGQGLVQQALGRPAEIDAESKIVLRQELLPDKSVAIFLGKTRLGLQETRKVVVSFLDQYDLSKLTVEELELVKKLLRKAERRSERPDGDAAGEPD